MTIRCNIFILIPAFLLTCAVSGFAGMIIASGKQGMKLYLEEKAIFEKKISGDNAFRNVRIEQYSAGGITIVGSVDSQNDFVRLKNFSGNVSAKSKTIA